ncbi:hypothetical protein fugu_010095 [Takifugu bimaculatus]|uniref:Pre-B-cell leukemia homeobox interacting protein 1b n=1 Tax=Takifugu bimaculatus TaxID=433685 RepID=A0A4Z2CEB9_9TELE|nr:hypothetical protein fugu_010095 [Takifugu bimaculatus]
MSGGTNSWTILTSEGSVAETMRPVAEGTQRDGESEASAEESQAASSAASAEGDMVPENKRAELNGDGSTDGVPPCLDSSSSFPSDGDSPSQSEGLPEGPTQPSAEPDSFSDSFANLTPSSDEPAASALNTETLGRVDLTEDDEGLSQEGAHRRNVEGLQEEGLQSEQRQDTAGVGNQAEATVATEGGEQKPPKAAAEVGPQLRRRRSLLASLERIGRAEEEEETEEEFRLPRQQEDSGFSVNKCILAALILLGLGTIFFSGFFMEPDEESGYAPNEPRDADLPENQEWMSTEAPQPDAESAELLNQLAKGSQQISELQAQLQAQTEELKVAKGRAEEGAKERMQWGEVEKENSRLKTEMASLPVLQKENQRMKKELDSLLALQKELETLRATVTELKLPTAPSELPVKDSASPPTGQTGDSTQGAAELPNKDKSSWDEQRVKYQHADKSQKHKGMDEQKVREKSQWMEGGRKKNDNRGKAEWETGERQPEKFSKEKYNKGKKETEPWQKDSARRGDEGKSWKDRKGGEEWKEKSDRKEWNEEKDWKKAKQLHQGAQLKKEQKKDWKERDGERHKGGEERKVENKGYRESGKEKWDKQQPKEKGGKKEWKPDGQWKNSQDQSKEGKWKSEKAQDQESRGPRKDGKGWGGSKEQKEKEWKSRSDGNKWKKDERNQEMNASGRDGTHKEEWKRADKKQRGRPKQGMKDGDGSPFRRDGSKVPGHRGNHDAHLRGEREPSRPRPSVKQPEYWLNQRTRLQRNPKPPQHCHSVETCAQTEGLPPVTFREFEAVLHTYLARAKEVGVDASAREELQKLATEFFKDGLFVHDQMRFQDFVEDLGDVLEDMVEGDDDDDDDEEGSAIEEEMEGFQREVMRKFSSATSGGKEGTKGDRRKESRRGHA